MRCAVRYGVERTGLFCAIMNMMDQLVKDDEVDVFDAVKRVRQARPEFIESIVRLLAAVHSLVFSLCYSDCCFTLLHFYQ